MTNGQWLWTRTIGSTVVGEAVDSVLFYPLAFYGIVQQRAAADRDDHELSAEDGLGSSDDAGHVQGRGIP
jgi:uncharacterized PurR-regulated membrane protein YhhQ (DUF165 family)